MIYYHNLDPVIFSLGPLDIKYYGLAYALGILISLSYIKKLNKKQYVMPEREYDDMLVYIVLGILLGGRIGYFVFYNLFGLIANPGLLFRIWDGGMSFHGGLIGIIISIYIFAVKNKIPFFRITDILAPATPIGLFLGRIANFINGELWGRPTGQDWGVIFPMADGIARHPSQLYQALFEGLLLFLILNNIFFGTILHKKRGFFSGFFLVLYALFRMITEIFREPDYHLGFIFLDYTMGQLLSIPMAIAGCLIMYMSLKKR